MPVPSEQESAPAAASNSHSHSPAPALTASAYNVSFASGWVMVVLTAALYVLIVLADARFLE